MYIFNLISEVMLLFILCVLMSIRLILEECIRIFGGAYAIMTWIIQKFIRYIEKQKQWYN